MSAIPTTAERVVQWYAKERGAAKLVAATQALRALGNLCFDHDDNRTLVADRGGLDATKCILELLQRDSAAFTTSPRRRCATCRSTSHAGARNSAALKKWPHASNRPERNRGARGAHSAYVAAAPRAAETAAACAFPPAASPVSAQRIAAAKWICV